MNKPIPSQVHLSRMKFQVTAENIRDACKINSRHCMIADAIAAKLPRVRNISVDMMTVRWSDPAKGWRYVYLTPKPAQYALIYFDMGLEKKIKPFSFIVRSGHASPMYLGTGKNRKRAHKVPEDKIVNVTDNNTVVHSVGRDSIPMWPAKDSIPKGKDSLAGIGRDPTPKGGRGRPREWHPSHHTLREFGMRGFTEGFIPRAEAPKPKA